MRERLRRLLARLRGSPWGELREPLTEQVAQDNDKPLSSAVLHVEPKE